MTKSLIRYFVPTLAPDGRQFPMSLTSCRGPINVLSSSLIGGEDRFPHNVQFVCVCDDCSEQEKHLVFLPTLSDFCSLVIDPLSSTYLFSY